MTKIVQKITNNFENYSTLTGRQTDRQTDWPTDCPADRRIDRQTDRLTSSENSRSSLRTEAFQSSTTDRPTDRDRQTDWPALKTAGPVWGQRRSSPLRVAAMSRPLDTSRCVPDTPSSSPQTLTALRRTCNDDDERQTTQDPARLWTCYHHDEPQRQCRTQLELVNSYAVFPHVCNLPALHFFPAVSNFFFSIIMFFSNERLACFKCVSWKNSEKLQLLRWSSVDITVINMHAVHSIAIIQILLFVFCSQSPYYALLCNLYLGRLDTHCIMSTSHLI